MARGFGNLGTASTDRIQTALTTQSTLRSFSIWAWVSSVGNSNAGSYFDKSNAAVQHDRLVDSGDGTNSLQYKRLFSGSLATWGFPRPAAQQWFSVIVTTDTTAPQAPLMYLNGISQTVTEYVAASGTVTDNADSYFLGNRGSGDRIENCLLAEFAVWDRILTATEAMQIYYSKLPSTIDGCVLYVPVLGVSPEPDYITGGTQTVTGALPQNHPPQFERYQSATYQTRPRAFGAGIAR